MGKTSYFLGFGVLIFLLFSLINHHQRTVPQTEAAETSPAMQGLVQQLGFMTDFALVALRKIDNPGILALTEELNNTYFDLLASFKAAAAREMNLEVAYVPTAEHKHLLHQLLGIRLEQFEAEYLPLLITELGNLQQAIDAASAAPESAVLADSLAGLDQTTRRYLAITRELIPYQAQLL